MPQEVQAGSPFKGVFARPFPSRGWPIWARYGASAAIVTAVLMLRLWLDPYLPRYPILLFFIPTFACALLFDRGTGVFSVLLSAACIAYFLLPPIHSLAVSDSQNVLGLAIFVAIGLAIAAVIETLHRALYRLTKVNDQLLRANERLTQSDWEKDLLLREVGHRIRNDLTALVSLVQLQQRSIHDEAGRTALGATADRIRVLARVHDRLQRADEAAVVNTRDFICALCDDLRASTLGLRPIAIRVEVEPHDLLQQTAVSLGLVINELVTNALKYAFPDDRSGIVEVRLMREDDGYRLLVTDDGVGLGPEGTHRPKGSGLGQRLIRSMVAQLGGRYEIGLNAISGGTVATVSFPAT